MLYEDNLETDLLGDKQIIRSAICILQTDTDTADLIEKLPDNIETFTLIQGYAIGTKTLKFSHLTKFKNLLSLELQGPNSLNQQTNSTLISEIDMALPFLRFLNFENVQIKNSVIQIQNFVKEISHTSQTFAYVQKFDDNTHELTMVQEGAEDEVLPYEKYKQQDNEQKIPLFVGFKNLFLLRITHCELKNVHWAMFDGLSNLQYLILDKNNLRFIPPFAFYGTPNLRSLSLAHNNLLNIQITDLAGLLELEYLDLSYNNFSQLSELSLPPFPKLKLADFRNNPITIIFPNTFEVMNTTDSLIIGSDNVKLSLMPNSFLGLTLLKALTLLNLELSILKRELFVGMPNLHELILTGNITQIEFDTFSDIYKLQKLILSNCNLRNISMDAFMGLENLHILDLSQNQLEELPPGVFDELINIKEIYLSKNHFTKLPHEIFGKIHAKMIRLNGNPWHCSCDMSDWKPVIVNRIKQKVINPCDYTHDKGVGCTENRFAFKYIYETKVAPQCAEPKQYLNWSVFHVMRRILKCPEYKPKIRKHHLIKNQTINADHKAEILKMKIAKHDDNFGNNINALPVINSQNMKNKHFQQKHKVRKIRKYKKVVPIDDNTMSNSII